MMNRFRPDDGEDESKMRAGIPLGIALLVYSMVSISLFAETGDPHVGQSWPLFGGILGLFLGIGIERRNVRGGSAH